MGRPGDLVLGLDGGGTKTVLAVADRTGAVAHIDTFGALDPLSSADWAATLAAGLAAAAPWSGRLAASVLGLSCFGEIEAVSDRQRRVATQLLPGRTQVINDVEAAFAGAFADGPGVLLLAGTGSMAWAGNGRETLRCGGWGDVAGDEGSAFSIGREALGEASRALDGRSGATQFAEFLLAAMGIGPSDLIGWCYRVEGRRTAIAALAATVDRLAERGEPTAVALLDRAAEALAQHVGACVARLGLPAEAPWSYAGSVFNSSTVMRRVTDRLGRAPTQPRLQPVGGALLRAARAAGWAPDNTWIDRLAQSVDAATHHARAA